MLLKQKVIGENLLVSFLFHIHLIIVRNSNVGINALIQYFKTPKLGSPPSLLKVRAIYSIHVFICRNSKVSNNIAFSGIIIYHK